MACVCILLNCCCSNGNLYFPLFVYSKVLWESHGSVVFGWSCEPKEDGEHPQILTVTSSLIQHQFVGSPRRTVPLLQWLVFIPWWYDKATLGTTKVKPTKTNKDPILMCWKTRDKLGRDVNRPVSLVSDQKHCLCRVMKWERNGEKRQNEREKSSLYVRYNKKGSSNWGLKPPVVRSVHFSNRGGTHCLLCAQRMGPHKKYTPMQWQSEAHTFQHKKAAWLHCGQLMDSITSALTATATYSSVTENTSHRSKTNAVGESFATAAVNPDSSDIKLQLSASSCSITHWQTNTEKHARTTGRKAKQCLYSLTTRETHPVQQCVYLWVCACVCLCCEFLSFM